MGVTRTELFTEEQNTLAAMAKALAHPARVAILQQLADTNTCVNGELVEELGLAQATVSQHLRELRDAGLIKGKVDGTSVCYCINEAKWTEVRAAIDALFSAYTCCNDDCC